MKRYRFGLQTVLHVRQTEEELARERLVAANSDVQQKEAIFATEAERYRNRVDEGGPCGLDHFRADRLEGEQVAACVAAARADLESAVAVAAVRRDEWSAAARRVAALERLDERRRNEWWIELRRQEDAEVNDLVTARWSGAASASGHQRGEMT